MQPADSLSFITSRRDVVFVRGRGSWLYDAEGREYLDFIQGWAVNSLGHSPQVIREALAAQADLVINVSPAYYNEPPERRPAGGGKKSRSRDQRQPRLLQRADAAAGESADLPVRSRPRVLCQ